MNKNMKQNAEVSPAQAGRHTPPGVMCEEDRDEAGETYYVVKNRDGEEICRGRSMTSLRWIAKSFALVDYLRDNNDSLLAERDQAQARIRQLEHLLTEVDAAGAALKCQNKALLALIKKAIDADDYGPEDWERWNDKAKALVARAEGGK